MNIDQFIILSNESIMAALKKINDNKKGFLIVINLEQKIIGTLTDGDIRRAFINGATTNDVITDIYNNNFKYVYVYDDFSNAVEIFKSDAIDFLPIIDKNRKVVNLVTKKNVHILLMEDIEFNFNYNFLSLDDSLLEHEIYNRPWGFYKTTFLNPYAQAKIIKVNPKGQLSLQEHKQREEHWVVVHGVGEVILGESVKKVAAGEYIFIPKGCKHKLSNTSNIQSLMVAEVQLGEYFGEDDIIRYEDIYGRVKK
ncbi:CBS domain-containing protein [Tissierella sp.]|uniref:CBS domain-containing protein n=1 Tax=Tissierella sp. TaxID=41274 RepID=UPI00302BA5C7